MRETVALLRDAPVSLPALTSGPLGSLPTLVTARWCPFTITATTFWSEVARAAGVALRVVDAEREEAVPVMLGAHVGGVPCLVAAPDRLSYGLQYSPSEAQAFLA